MSLTLSRAEINEGGVYLPVRGANAPGSVLGLTPRPPLLTISAAITW